MDLDIQSPKAARMLTAESIASPTETVVRDILSAPMMWIGDRRKSEPIYLSSKSKNGRMNEVLGKQGAPKIDVETWSSYPAPTVPD